MCDLAPERMPAREFSLPLSQPQLWTRALDGDDFSAEALDGDFGARAREFAESVTGEVRSVGHYSF